MYFSLDGFLFYKSFVSSIVQKQKIFLDPSQKMVVT